MTSTPSFSRIAHGRCGPIIAASLAAVAELHAEGRPRHLADHHVALRDGARVERQPGDAERGGVHGYALTIAPISGCCAVNRVVDSGGAAGPLARFAAAVAHQHQVLHIDDAPIDLIRRDHERRRVHAGRVAPLRADEQPLAVGAADELGQPAANLVLRARRRRRRAARRAPRRGGFPARARRRSGSGRRRRAAAP